MSLFPIFEPSFKIFFSININPDIVVEVSCDKSINDNSNKQGNSRSSMIQNLNDHSFGFEQYQKEKIKLNLYNLSTKNTTEKQLIAKQYSLPKIIYDSYSSL